ncbi:MAG: PEP-CTERM sorting domain-containing protein, partial [Isosphaeraceae bacterium]
MMHRIQGWTGLRAAVIALGLVAWTATGATAAPLSYTTSGQVDTTNGVSGTNVVSFVPLSSGNSVNLSTGQTNVGLGNFVISPLADNATTTYDHTPIQISFQPQSYDGKSISSNAPVVVSGVLNGVVNGPSSSTVKATFDPVSNGLISLGGNGTATFSLPTNQLLLAPSTSNNGTTSAQGLVTSSTESTVPEPSTIALFLTTVGGLGLRRYVQSR